MLLTTTTFLMAYLLGSMTSAIWLCYLFKLPDPRTQGSGNPGATNVLRFGGKKLAAMVLLLDLCKGALAVYLASYLLPDHTLLAWTMLACVLGHMFPLFAKFQGGKGVATSLGTLIVLSPLLALGCFILWLLIAIGTRYSSLAAMLTCLALIIVCTTQSDFFFLAGPATVTGLLLIMKHRTNLIKLYQGRESKIKL